MACALVRATTTATGSPTKRTRPMASSGRANTPGLSSTGGMCSPPMSPAVNTPDDTGHRAGAVRIDRPDERVRHRGPDEHPVQRPLAGDIVQVSGRPGEQRAILAAEHGTAQDLPERRLLQQVRSVGGHACGQLEPRMPSGISSPWASIRSSHMATTCWVVSVAAVFGSSSAAW